jgi:hypothetical protein
LSKDVHIGNGGFPLGRQPRTLYAESSMKVKLRVHAVYMAWPRRMLEKARSGSMSKGG